MSSEALKKRKAKVLRNEAGPAEVKRGRGDGDQQVTETNSETFCTVFQFAFLSKYCSGILSNIISLFGKLDVSQRIVNS